MDFLDIGPDSNAPQSTIQNLYQFTDNLSWVKGKHSLKFGFDGRKFIAPQSFTQRVRGDYEWNNLTEYLHDVAPTNFGERSTGNFFYYGDQTAFYGYVNDTYRVTEKLSINSRPALRVHLGSGRRARTAAQSRGQCCRDWFDFSSPQPQKKNILPRVGIQLRN